MCWAEKSRANSAKINDMHGKCGQAELSESAAKAGATPRRASPANTKRRPIERSTFFHISIFHSIACTKAFCLCFYLLYWLYRYLYRYIYRYTCNMFGECSRPKSKDKELRGDFYSYWSYEMFAICLVSTYIFRCICF